MREIYLTVGNKMVGDALTWAYPHGQSLGVYRIPTYHMEVRGIDDAGKERHRNFEVFRFGVEGKLDGTARVVGLADHQVHIIKTWLPNYTVHSARSKEKGAWQVYDNFLIHDGPDNPKAEVYASIGCIEVCNGPNGFDLFNDYLIDLSGSAASSRDKKLAEIGQAGKMKITYLAAARPPLKRS